MSLIAKNKKSDFSPAPEGLHSAVCCDVVDLGIVQDQFGEREQVEIRWQLEESDPESKEGYPYMVLQRYTLSLHEKSRLRPMLEAWRGRKFTNEELEGFDLEKLLGVNCQIQVCHNISSKGNTYANVQAVVPPARGAIKLVVNHGYVRVSEREKRAELEKHPYKAADEDVPF